VPLCSGLTPTYALKGLTEVLLACAGYFVSTSTVPRVGVEFMAPFRPGSLIGRSDVIIAHVACPPDDPGLRLLPRRFSMGCQSAKVDVIPAFEPIATVGPAWLYATRQGVYPVDEETGAATGTAPAGLGRGPSTSPAAGPARVPGGLAPGSSREHDGAGAPADPMPVDDPADRREGGELRSEGGPTGLADTIMSDGAAEGSDTPSVSVGGVYTGREFAEWLTGAGTRWDTALTEATEDEVPREGVEVAEVLGAFYARFAGDPAVDIRQSPPGGDNERYALPRVVQQWLSDAGYVQAYDVSSSEEASDAEAGGAVAEGVPPGPNAGRSVSRQRQQQQQQQRRPSLRGQGDGLPAPVQAGSTGQAPPGGHRPRTGVEPPPRRGTRDRRQAPLASELPGSLATSPPTVLGAHAPAHPSSRPPHSAARSVRRWS
jgi:hypothetical protein